MYIERPTHPGPSLQAELIAAGIPVTSVGYTNRRKNGITVTLGQPYAVYLPGLDESFRAAAEAVLAAHVPFFGNVQAKVAATKAEAQKRIESTWPAWRQRRTMLRWFRLIEKRLAGGTLTVDETNRLTSYLNMDNWIKARADASDAIEVRIATMTDAEAGAFDVTTAAEWST